MRRIRPARWTRAGRRRWGSVGVGLAAAGPDEVEAFAIFVLDEVRVDRSVEARAVQLDREIVTLLRGALRPSRADLGAADEGPMARPFPLARLAQG